MDPTFLPNQSLDNDASNAKPSFRKLPNDASGRSYRRHSPSRGMGSSSSSSDESSKYGKDHAQQFTSRDLYVKDGSRRRDDGKELDRDGDPRNRYGRSGRDHRYADRDHRGYQKSSRSGREPRDGHDHLRKEDRSKGSVRSCDKYSRDRYDNSHRNNDSRSIEWDWKKDRVAQDERRDRRRSPGKYSSDSTHSNARDSSSIYMKSTHRTGSRESAGHDESINRRSLEKQHECDKNKYNKESEDILNKRCSSFSQNRNFRDDADKGAIHDSEEQNILVKKHKSSHMETTFESVGRVKLPSKWKSVAEDEETESSSKKVKETISKFTTEPVISSSSLQEEAAPDLNAAKVAAMKAAELVNKNIAGGGGLMSTDQKKKLLWGNKKKATPEESGSRRWDQPLFSDNERQEKFNKLMGVKGGVSKPEHKPEVKDGGIVQVEQVEMDLEKQYTAGLRRRDGRTVGLGL